MSKSGYVCGADSILRDKNNNNKPVSELSLCQEKSNGGSGFTSHCQIMANGWSKEDSIKNYDVDLSAYNDDYRCETDGTAYKKWKKDNSDSKEENPYYDGQTMGAYTFCHGKKMVIQALLDVF